MEKHHARPRRRWVLAMLVAACVLLAAVAGSPATGAAKKFQCKGGAIKVGVAQGKTGGFAFFDYAGYKGFQIGIDQINRAGGIQGCKFQILFGDTKSDPARTQQVAADLIKRGAQIIKTPTDFDMGVGASLAAREAKVFSFSAEASSVDWAKAVKGQVVMGLTTNDLPRAQAVFAGRRGWTTAYVVTNEAFNYFKSMETVFRRQFKGTITGRDVVADDATDYAAIVSKIRDASPSPDVVYLNDYFPHVGTFIKQLRDAGVNTPVLGNQTYSSPALVGVVGKQRIQNVFYAAQIFFEGPTATPGARRFVAQYRAKYKSPPENANPIAGFEGAYVLANALRRAGSTDAAKVYSAMIAQRNLRLPTGATILRWTNGYTHRSVSLVGFNAAGQATAAATIR